MILKTLLSSGSENWSSMELDDFIMEFWIKGDKESTTIFPLIDMSSKNILSLLDEVCLLHRPVKFEKVWFTSVAPNSYVKLVPPVE